MKRILRVTQNKGFTLIELLVVTAILGILIGVSSSVFIGILRSQNKTGVTNEVRQNATLAVDLFERDLRSAANVTSIPLDTNEIQIVTTTGDIIWHCEQEVLGVSNGWISRQPPVGPVEFLTNRDTVNGVSIDCDLLPPSFFVTTSNTPIVTFRFTAKQGVSAPTRADFEITIPFETTVGIREF